MSKRLRKIEAVLASQESKPIHLCAAMGYIAGRIMEAFLKNDAKAGLVLCEIAYNDKEYMARDDRSYSCFLYKEICEFLTRNKIKADEDTVHIVECIINIDCGMMPKLCLLDVANHLRYLTNRHV